MVKTKEEVTIKRPSRNQACNPLTCIFHERPEIVGKVRTLCFFCHIMQKGARKYAVFQYAGKFPQPPLFIQQGTASVLS